MYLKWLWVFFFLHVILLALTDFSPSFCRLSFSSTFGCNWTRLAVTCSQNPKINPCSRSFVWSQHLPPGKPNIRRKRWSAFECLVSCNWHFFFTEYSSCLLTKYPSHVVIFHPVRSTGIKKQSPGKGTTFLPAEFLLGFLPNCSRWGNFSPFAKRWSDTCGSDR